VFKRQRLVSEHAQPRNGSCVDRFADAGSADLPRCDQGLAALAYAGLRLAVVSNFDPTVGIDPGGARTRWASSKRSIVSSAAGRPMPSPTLCSSPSSPSGLQPQRRSGHVRDTPEDGAGRHGRRVLGHLPTILCRP